jgi:hypothetical protein
MDDALRLDTTRPRGPVDARWTLWHLTATPFPHQVPGPAIPSVGRAGGPIAGPGTRPHRPESQVQEVHGLDVRRAGDEDRSMVTQRTEALMRIAIVALGAALLVAACGSTATPLPASQAPASTLASPSASASAAAASSAASPSAATASAGAVASTGALGGGSFALPSGVTGSAAAALGAMEQAIQQQGGPSATPPPWLSEITGASVNGSTLVVDTSLASRTADVTAMCTALSSALSVAASAGISGFDIQGVSGQTLVAATSGSASC